MTEQGAVMGTPDYVAPEQVVDASSADIRSDLYSLGCTLYYLLTGRPPFAEGSTQEKLRAHVHDIPQSLTELNRDVPPQLDDIVMRMLAKDPEARLQTPAEVAAAVRPFTQTTATRAGGAGSRFHVFAAAVAAFILENVTVEGAATSAERTSQVILPPRRENSGSRARDGPTTVRLQLDVQPTDTVPIALNNSGIEEPPLSDGGSVANEIPDWRVESEQPGAAGVTNPRDDDFAGATDPAEQIHRRGLYS